MAFDYPNLKVLAIDSIQWTKKLTEEEQVAQLELFLATNSWVGMAHFAIVYLGHSSEVFTAVPDSVLATGSEAATLAMIAPLDEVRTSVHANRHIQRGFHMVFALPKVWEQWAQQRFAGTTCQWLSEVSGFLEAGFAVSKTQNERFLLALVDLDSVLFVGIDDSKLLYVNRFGYKSENDLLYFFLLALDCCALEPADGKVVLAGSVLVGSAGYEKLARYLDRMESVKLPSQIRIPEKLSMLAHHSWFDLLSLPLCINQLA